MSQGPSKKDLLRRYLEQNGSEPNPRNDTLDRLAMKREVLKWEKEQKEEAEQTRREFLEYQQSERMKRLNSETSSGRIALAKGSQAGLELPEPQLIREMFAARKPPPNGARKSENGSTAAPYARELFTATARANKMDTTTATSTATSVF